MSVIAALMVDLSNPDNSDFNKGRSIIVRILWHFVGFSLVRSSCMPVSAMKAALLRLFGARIGKGVYIKPGLKVKFPWYLSVGDHCWLGEDVWIDNLADVTIGSHVCVSQGAYLCTGNHDWKTPNMKLFRKPITIEDGGWIGAKAVLCPGVVVGPEAIVTVGSVVTRNIPGRQIWTGNPARFARYRDPLADSLELEMVSASSQPQALTADTQLGVSHANPHS